MAQIQTRNNVQGLGELTCLLQSPVDTYIPSSPDPTPLRMLAFSVAESALQADPNSPMFGSLQSMPPQDPWGKTTTSRWSVEPKVSLASRRGQSKPMWDVIDKARERREKREKECEYHQSMPKTPANLAASPSTVDSSLPTSPVSPTDYNFVLPTGSHLVASLGPGAAPSKHGLQMPAASPTKQYFPQFTQSAEPSPIKSTFEGLDQTLPTFPLPLKAHPSSSSPKLLLLHESTTLPEPPSCPLLLRSKRRWVMDTGEMDLLVLCPGLPDLTARAVSSSRLPMRSWKA
jgi:hypothetical protein